MRKGTRLICITGIILTGVTIVFVSYYRSPTRNLKEAVYQKDWEYVKQLVNNGAPVNIPLDWKKMHYDAFSPLTAAVHDDRIDIVSFLLDHGADIRMPGPYNVGPLRYAVGRGNVPMVKLLLDHGADPNEANRHNEAPVWSVAAGNGRMDIITLFAQAGAQFDEVALGGGHWWDHAPEEIQDYIRSVIDQKKK